MNLLKLKKYEGLVSDDEHGLTQQLTKDYTLNPHVWNELADKMNEMAEENILIKQAVLSTYEKMKSRYPVSRTRNQNSSKDSAMHLILKLNPSLATSTNSVSTIAEETESQLEVEAEGQTHNLSSDCKVIINILHPDADYSSDSDSNKLNYADH